MPSYRLFRFEGEKRQRSPGEWLEAADDDEALRRAREISILARCEVWLQNRLVGIIVHDPEAESRP